MPERVVRVKLTAQIAEYDKAMLEAARSTRAVGSEAEKLQQKKEAFNQIGTAAFAMGTAITAATALSIKAAIDWESAWAGVTKTVDGSAEQMAALEGDLRDLAQTLPATHQEIAAVAEAAGQLGVSRENIAAFTKTMIDLSETTNLTADEAATSIAQLTNVMQTAPEDVDNLGAALVALGNDGASTERDIIQMAQRIAGAGKVVGLTEADVLAFANALASVGIEAEAGGSAISRVMTDIAMAVSSGGDELDKFAKVAGVSAADFSASFKKDPAYAIASFVEGLGRINASGGDVFATLSDLGQTDIRVSQALLGMAGAGDLLRKSLDLGSEAWEENTALAVEAAKRYETTEARLQIAGNAVRDAAIDFGEVFLPAVKAAAEAVGEFAGFLGGLPDPVQGVLGILGSGIGLFTLFGGAALLAVPKIAEFKAALDTMGWSMRTVGIVGGGALIALTALVTVVGAVSAAQAEAQQRAESYANTLAEGSAKVTKATRDMAKEALAARDSFLWIEYKSAYDSAEKLGISLDLVTDAATGNAEALEELERQLKANGSGQAVLAGEAANVRNAVKGEADSIEEAIEIAKQKQQADADSADASKTAAAAYMEAADQAGSLGDEIRGLIDAINQANGIGQDAVSTNARYQAALAGISAEVQRQKDEFEEANGTLNGFTLSLDQATASGSANASSLAEVASAAQAAAAAQFEQDKTTMSAKDATDKYIGTLAAQRQAFIDSAVEAGYNADEVAALADQVFKLPDAKQVKVIAETAEAQGVINRFIFANDGRRINLIVDGQVGRQVNGVDVMARANGGIEQYAQAFASGGFPTGIYKGVPGGIHKFAEPETGWEAYISGKPDQRSRNVGIWQETGRRLGVDASPTVQAGPVYVQNPFTGEYLLARAADIADASAMSATAGFASTFRGGRR